MCAAHSDAMLAPYNQFAALKPSLEDFMTQPGRTRLADIVGRNEKSILDEWMRLQAAALSRRRDLISDQELQRDSTAFLAALRKAAEKDADVRGASWDEVRGVLAEISRTRARLGFSPSDTAVFVFSLKQPVFMRLRQELGSDAQALADETWTATLLLDTLGLYTVE